MVEIDHPALLTMAIRTMATFANSARFVLMVELYHPALSKAEVLQPCRLRRSLAAARHLCALGRARLLHGLL